MSHDGTVYTFYLNPNALWSDGSRVTAEDFVFAWLRVLDPTMNAPSASNLYMIKNAKAYHRGEIKDASTIGIKAISSDVLEVTLDHPVPYFLQLTSFITLYPVPKKSVMQFGKSWSDMSKLVSNGPFILMGQPESNMMLLKKNQRYWDAEHVRMQEVRVYGIQDSKTALKLYTDGKLDYTGETTLPFADLAKWRFTSDFHSVPWFAVNFLRFNTTRAPFNNLAVRRAVQMAIDKEKIVNYVVPGGHVPAGSIVPIGMKGYSSPQVDSVDSNQARMLLASAGYCVPSSTSATASLPSGCKPFPEIQILVDNNESEKKMVLGIQQMLMKELGIDRIKINVVNDFQKYLELRRKVDFDIARSRWVGEYYDPNTFLEIWTSDNANNNTGWKNSKYDELISLAASEQNERKRMELFNQAERLLLTELPIVPIYNVSQNYLLKPYVRNYIDNMQRLLLLKDVYIEHYSTLK
jgi:oligopeptide transport system substrate-binding protein